MRLPLRGHLRKLTKNSGIIFIFAGMGRNRTISLIFCLLAFLVVFAHSVIPHEHHCNSSEVENHIHYFRHCEGLNTYVLKNTTAAPAPMFSCLAPSESSAFTPDLPEVLERLIFDTCDHFRKKSAPDIPHGALRGPPAV